MLGAGAPIRIALVQRHKLLREGLRALIESWSGLQLVAETDTPDDVFNIVREQKPDIILIEVGPQENDAALSLLAALRDGNSHTRPILLADSKESPILIRAVALGAMGVVLKDQPPNILENAIRKVHTGEVWLERVLTATALREMAGGNGSTQADPDAAKIATLSKRELEVVALVCQGMHSESIGKQLAISEATVRHHLTSIFHKLALQNRLELVIFAFNNALVKPTKG